MENRFGFRDVVYSTLLIVVLVAVVLTSCQYDRQLDKVVALEDQVDDLSKLLGRTDRSIQAISNNMQMLAERPPVVINGEAPDGVTTRPGGGIALLSPDDYAARFGTNSPFQDIIEARKQPDFAEGGRLVRAFQSPVPKLTPYVSLDAYASYVQDYVLEPLITVDPRTLDYVPYLAKSWELDPGDEETGEPIRVTFELRDDVGFSTGQRMTADDVVFTYNVIMNEKVEAPRPRGSWRKVKEVNKLGPYTVEFVFAERYFDPVGLAGSMLVLPKDYYAEYVEDPNTGFNRIPGLLVGSGPYKLRKPLDWTSSQDIVLERNFLYWGVPPALDSLVYRVIQTSAAELTAFRNGEIDVFGATPDQYDQLREDDDFMDGVISKRYYRLDGGYTYIGWNQGSEEDPTLFGDQRVRQAMTMLTNRPALVRRIYRGYAEIVTGPFSPEGNQVNPEVDPWPYDPRRARELLKEAGWEMGDDGILVNRETGKKFSFRITYSGNNAMTREFLSLIAESYRLNGVDIQLSPLEWGSMLDSLNRRTYEAITLGWTGGRETDVHQMFHSEMNPDGDNFVQVDNPELDKLIDQARSTLDEDKRMALWKQVHAIIHEEQPYTFLVRRKGLAFINDRFKNVQKTRYGLNDGRQHWVIGWYIPADLQR